MDTLYIVLSLTISAVYWTKKIKSWLIDSLRFSGILLIDTRKLMLAASVQLQPINLPRPSLQTK